MLVTFGLFPLLILLRCHQATATRFYQFEFLLKGNIILIFLGQREGKVVFLQAVSGNKLILQVLLC